MKLINLHTWGIFPFSFPMKINTEAKGNLHTNIYISQGKIRLVNMFQLKTKYCNVQVRNH